MYLNGILIEVQSMLWSVTLKFPRNYTVYTIQTVWYFYVCLSPRPSIRLSASVCLSVCLYVCLSLFLSLSLSLCAWRHVYGGGGSKRSVYVAELSTVFSKRHTSTLIIGIVELFVSALYIII